MRNPATPVYNFSAGPATLPAAVLHEAQAELTNYHETGMSVLTFSHRSERFLEILHRAEADLRSLLAIPDDYAVLFLQGGASLQFSATAWNLAGQNKKVGAVVSGYWSSLAYQELKKIPELETTLVATSEEDGRFFTVPEPKSWRFPADLDFIHFTSNETVDGTEYRPLPGSLGSGEPFLVCDMSSDILSRPVKVEDFGLIYAGAQKNIGAAGVTLVIARRDLIGRAPDNLASVLSYEAHLKKDGMYNTPNTFGIYLCSLVLQWLQKEGGITAIQTQNEKKARALYAAIDTSGGFYRNEVEEKSRSLMNILFFTPSKELDQAFAREAEARGLYFLAGHKRTGGIRASIYNAMPMAGVEALIAFMADFRAQHAL